VIVWQDEKIVDLQDEVAEIAVDVSTLEVSMHTGAL
jgi:hypothetical protein